MRVIVIGGVAAGMSAASKLKRLNKDVDIIVYEKGQDLSYAACGMPYFLSDIIKDEDALIARTKDQFEKNGIRVEVMHEVTGVNPKTKQITGTNLKSNEPFQDSYDKLIIATGAKGIRLPIEGSDLAGIHTLNSLDDAKALKTALKKAENKTVAIIGGGYIGLEVAENLREMNKNVIVIEMLPRLLNVFNPFISEAALKCLKDHQVDVYLNETVKSYHGDKKVQHVKTDKGTYDVDLIIEAVGVKPNTSFLDETSIKRLKNGAIVVNDKMETSANDIYSAGDCVAYPHRLRSLPAHIPLGTHANKAGRVIAEQIAGNDERFNGVLGSSVLRVFDLEIAKTGLSTKEAENDNRNYDVVRVKSRDKADYYPGASPIDIEILYDKDSCKLLGVQMIGVTGVAQRINTAATAIHNNMTAKAYASIDFAYAPPFSPVYDPLHIAAMQVKCDK